MALERHIPNDNTRVTRTFDAATALDALLDAKQLEVCLYFMGRARTFSQLHAWATNCLGPNPVDQFTSLSKGFYYAHFTPPCPVLHLVTQQVVRGAGFYAH